MSDCISETPTSPPARTPLGDAVLVQPSGGPPWLTMPTLESSMPGVRVAFSTRLGGVSTGPFAALNLGGTTRDDPACVAENRRRWSVSVGCALQEWTRQVHGCDVRVIEDPSSEPAPEQWRADAVITACRGVPLTIYVADCVPIALLDPVTPAVGVVHAGWRGTFQEIAGVTVRRMEQAFGSKPADLLVAIGPSIGPCCFEVDVDVSEPVRQRFPEWQESVIGPKNMQKSTIDLWEWNRLQLERSGVLRRNIAIARLCTACRPDLFFSYRRDHGETGRLAVLAALS